MRVESWWVKWEFTLEMSLEIEVNGRVGYPVYSLRIELKAIFDTDGEVSSHNELFLPLFIPSCSIQHSRMIRRAPE